MNKHKIHQRLRKGIAMILACSSLLLAVPASAAGAFEDPLNAVNYDRFYVSDGWGNGDDFGVFWKEDNVEFNNGIMALRLDKPSGCPSQCEGKPYASGEYATNDNTYGYGRVEARLKVAKGTGLVTSLFTYYDRDPDPNVNRNDEIDIEILGKDTTKLETNYYTNGVGEHSTVIDLGFDASLAFHTYAFEWSPTSIKWYVDGKLVHTENGSRGELPSHPGHIMVNFWAGANDAAKYWTGDLAYPGSPVRAYYDYIKYTPAQ
ncbi:family 16 glycosylhydrolase [Paenibacillus jiagnxiensis]|uniref:family 16 glycosylhydrolase n=1 Tax=Paenibacillus jiagnxiensis TaxID=3228926 RepID=UPI0033B4ACFF